MRPSDKMQDMTKFECLVVDCFKEGFAAVSTGSDSQFKALAQKSISAAKILVKEMQIVQAEQEVAQ